MGKTENLIQYAGVQKLREIIEEINICMFCTNLKTDNGSTCSPMDAQKVCDEGNIWFFSDVNSFKNREIKMDKHVQLFFSLPGKDIYLIVNGDAEIIIDRKKTEELWMPLVKKWFVEGKVDPNVSLIKVKPQSAYYWDNDGYKMINFFKTLPALARESIRSNGIHERI